MISEFLEEQLEADVRIGKDQVEVVPSEVSSAMPKRRWWRSHWEF